MRLKKKTILRLEYEMKIAGEADDDAWLLKAVPGRYRSRFCNVADETGLLREIILS